MSTYYHLWKANESTGQLAVLVLAGLGLGLGLGWLLINWIVPARLQKAIRWLYMSCVGIYLVWFFL